MDLLVHFFAVELSGIPRLSRKGEVNANKEPRLSRMLCLESISYPGDMQ